MIIVRDLFVCVCFKVSVTQFKVTLKWWFCDWIPDLVEMSNRNRADINELYLKINI